MLNNTHAFEMAQNILKVPKLSLLGEERIMLNNIEEYLAVLQSLYYRRQNTSLNSLAGFSTREMKFVEILSTNFLQELVATVQQASSDSYAADSRSKTARIDEKVFTIKCLSKWRKEKKRLKKLLMQYRAKMEKLKESQIACWKSRSKVHNYSLMVDVAQKSLHHYTEDKTEFHERTVALKGLKADLASKCKVHTKNMCRYDNIYEKVDKMKTEMVRLSDLLEQDITDKVKAKLQTSKMESHPELATLDRISKCLYDIIVHTLTITEPPSDVLQPEFNKPIRLPDEETRLYSKESTKRMIAECKDGLKSTVSDESISQSDIGIKQVSDKIHDLSVQTHEIYVEPEPATQSNVPQKKKGFFRSARKLFTRKITT